VRNARLFMGGVLAGLVVVGIVLLAVDAQIAAFAVFAVAAVDVTAWAFYEVGASEDRDRAAGRD
jgi:hypothetical protein